MSRNTSASHAYQGQYVASEAAQTGIATLSGWTVFSGVMLLLAGSFGMISGFVALLDSSVYVVGDKGVVLLDITQWGWIHLIVGGLVALAGLVVMSTGSGWARAFGVLAIVVQMIVQVGFIEAYPYWTIATLALDFIVIYGLIVSPISDATATEA